MLTTPERYPIHPTFAPLRTGMYGGLLLDPPWKYKTFSAKGMGRSPDKHYRTLTLKEIAALPVGELAAKSCHMLMWIPGFMLAQGAHLPLFEAYGFKPSSVLLVWLKSKKGRRADLFFELSVDLFVKGMGLTSRQNAEFVILGRKGRPERATKSMHQLLIEPRREHSRKPEEFYKRVSDYVPAGVPVAELFARQSRIGIDTWGNERTLFDVDAGKLVGGTK